MIEDLLDCPWGCGLPKAHDPSDSRCPPSRSDGQWANSRDSALGTTRQLREDVRVLKEQMSTTYDKECVAFLRHRVNVIQRFLDR